MPRKSVKKITHHLDIKLEAQAKELETQTEAELGGNDELLETILRARKLAQTTTSSGWKEVIEPYLVSLNSESYKKIIAETELTKIVRYQEQIKIVNMIFNYIQVCLSEAKEVLENSKRTEPEQP
jgi:hypothetical protein